MNQLSRRAVATIARGLAVWMLLLLAGTKCLAQDYPVGILQITSPTDGTVVHPGQTVAVTVAPVSGNVFTGVMLAGPFVFSAPLYSAPYQFSLTVPQNIAAGKYRIEAIGGRQGQTFGTSNPIILDVEPAAAITKIRVQPVTIPFSQPGEVGTLSVFGTFADGSTIDISQSTGTTYTSADTTAVTVSSNGLVTAVGVGKFGNTPILVQYGGRQFTVLASTRRLAVSSTSGPGLAAVSPMSGALGTSLTLIGTNFGTTQGTSTVTFNGTPGTPTSWSSTSIVVPVPSGATTGNVVVTVGGTPSNGLNFTVQGTTAGIFLVQHVGKDIGQTTSASLAFNSSNSAGNWIGVCIRAGVSGQKFTVADSIGNKYRQAVQINDTLDTPYGNTLAIFYAENVRAGANTITVSDTISNTLRFAILEYTGVVTANSPDVTASAQGTGRSPNSGKATTTASGDLLLGAIATADPANFSVPAGIVMREQVPAEPNTKLIAVDQIQALAGTASTSASLAASDPWGAVLAAFKKAHP